MNQDFKTKGPKLGEVAWFFIWLCAGNVFIQDAVFKEDISASKTGCV